jgi:hypothetical protein
MMIPITPLLAGLFGDRIFEPAMQPGGALVQSFGWLVGVGPGAGFGLLIFLCGIGGTMVGVSGYLMREILDLDMQTRGYLRRTPAGVLSQDEPILVTSEESQPENPPSTEQPPGTEMETVPGAEETQNPQSDD